MQRVMGIRRKNKLRKIRPSISLQKTEMLQKLQQQQQQQQQESNGSDSIRHDQVSAAMSSNYKTSSDGNGSQSQPMNSPFAFGRALSAAEIIPHILSLPLSEIRLFHAWWQTYLSQTPAWTPLKFATTNATAIANANQYTNSTTNNQHVISPTSAAATTIAALLSPTSTILTQTAGPTTLTSTSHSLSSNNVRQEPSSAPPFQDDDEDDDDDEFDDEPDGSDDFEDEVS